MKLVFDLASVPSIFQRTMTTLLTGLNGVLVYLVVFLVTGKNKNEHIEKLLEIFNSLE